jgi:hypothetical protein
VRISVLQQRWQRQTQASRALHLHPASASVLLARVLAW